MPNPKHSKGANILGELLESKIQLGSKELQELGVKIGKLYTDKGLPIDMALERLDYTQQQKLSILDGALQWLIEHKRLSGAPEKAIERQRKLNRQYIERFLTGKEVGAY